MEMAMEPAGRARMLQPGDEGRWRATDIGSSVPEGLMRSGTRSAVGSGISSTTLPSARNMTR